MTDAVHMTPNVARLRETLAHITAHPEDHMQSAWRCGTSACFAGHTAILAGAVWATSQDYGVEEEFPMPEGSVRVGDPGDVTDRTYCSMDVTYVRSDGVRVFQFVKHYARDHLGLSLWQADRLFEGRNTLADLTGMVNALTADVIPHTMDA